MKTPTALREISENRLFGKGDIFVLFGELFGRGYATGLLEEARSAGMQVIGITVGRRDEKGALRALTPEELQAAEANLGGKIINVPLMAGFDLDSPEGGPTPTDLISTLTLENWQTEKLDWDYVEQCRKAGVERFRKSASEAMSILGTMIPEGKNVFFAHTMAGGIPKAKIFLAIANRIYKGSGNRHLSSQSLIESDLGKLILKNFDEVSAETFRHLIEATDGIRNRVEAAGKAVRYSAYGYHGTEILMNGEYCWQTYTNYTQGYAKMRLEAIAGEAWAKGVKATVYNCPEIRTNSSDVFTGIELPLIPLLLALRHEGGADWAERQWRACEALLQEGFTLDDVMAKIRNMQTSEVMVPFYDIAAWPMPNSQAQADLTIGTSQEIAKMHQDPKALISDYLSALVVEATGKIIFADQSKPSAPVQWLNHDVVAKRLIASHAAAPAAQAQQAV